MKSDLSSARQTLRPFYEMNYVLIPDNQARVTIPFLDYPDDSDLDGGVYPNGSYPIPPNMPIETWPRGTGALTLQQWQMDATNIGGDRHGIIVAPGAGSAWETWQMKLTSSGWQASNGAKFDLNSNALRPAGWTSGDAAGLSMFAATVRYDECEARHGRTRLAPGREADAQRIYLPGHPFRLFHPGDLDKLSSNGAAAAA